MCWFPGDLADMITACENALCMSVLLTGIAYAWRMVISVYYFFFLSFRDPKGQWI